MFTIKKFCRITDVTQNMLSTSNSFIAKSSPIKKRLQWLKLKAILSYAICGILRPWHAVIGHDLNGSGCVITPICSRLPCFYNVGSKCHTLVLKIGMAVVFINSYKLEFTTCGWNKLLSAQGHECFPWRFQRRSLTISSVGSGKIDFSCFISFFLPYPSDVPLSMF